MIRITSEQGLPLRAFTEREGVNKISFHDRFGFVSEESLDQRKKLRRVRKEEFRRQPVALADAVIKIRVELIFTIGGDG